MHRPSGSPDSSEDVSPIANSGRLTRRDLISLSVIGGISTLVYLACTKKTNLRTTWAPETVQQFERTHALFKAYRSHLAFRRDMVGLEVQHARNVIKLLNYALALRRGIAEDRSVTVEKTQIDELRKMFEIPDIGAFVGEMSDENAALIQRIIDEAVLFLQEAGEWQEDDKPQAPQRHQAPGPELII